MSALENVIHANSRKKLKSTSYKSLAYSEGDLSTKCLNALFLTVEKYVASIKFTLFKENFMDIYKSNPDHLQDIYKQFQEQISLGLKEDIQEVYTTDEISFLISSPNKIVWKNYCDKIYRRCLQKEGPRAHFYLEKKNNNVEKLNCRLHKLELCNEEREDEILRNHEDILILKNGIQNLNRELMEELDKLYEITLPVTG